MTKIKRQDDKSKYVRIERAVAEEVSAFLFAVGNQFVSAKNAEAAFDCFKYSLDLNDKHHPAVYNLGSLYSVMNNMEGAYRMFSEALRMAPDDIMTMTALSEVCRKMGKLAESHKLLDNLMSRDPENYIVLSAMAILCYDEGRLSEAMEFNERGLAKKPGDLHMQLNKALIHMTYGRWEDQWVHYEYCLSYQKNEKMKHLSMADAWSGQDMTGKTLLVVSDQGSGDAIQFSRYIIDAKKLGNFAKVIYLVQPDLVELLSSVDGVDECIGFQEKYKVEYDIYSSLLGVMRVLKVSPENANRPPHLREAFSKELTARWASTIAADWEPMKKRIGIVWAGDPRHGNDHARSIPLAQFLKIVRGTTIKSSNIMHMDRKHGASEKVNIFDVEPVQGAQLFSFQVGPGLQQLAALQEDTGNNTGVVELGSDFRSFTDTAAALMHMDLLITCDTSVAHLAGCLGIPTWVLVPNPPEWRWLLSSNKSVWYDSVEVFRQANPKDWDSVMIAVIERLREFCQQ